MKIRWQILITLLLLAAALLSEQFTPLDVNVQNRFFDFSAGAWLLDPEKNYILHFLLYDGVKAALVVLSVLVLAVFAASFKRRALRRWRYACLLFLLTMALVPLALAGAKKYTHMYCPYQLSLYGGYRPHFKIFEPFPADYNIGYYGKGRCFPAGHASGGFALMCLFFCFKRRKARIWGLAAGVGLGGAMGLYQMLRGEHFLSHTLVSMLGAWLIILLLKLCLDRIKKKWPVFFEG